MLLFHNNLYSILLILTASIHSMHCMTPSQTLSELLSSSTPSNSNLSSLSSLLTTPSSSYAVNNPSSSIELQFSIGNLVSSSASTAVSSTFSRPMSSLLTTSISSTISHPYLQNNNISILANPKLLASTSLCDHDGHAYSIPRYTARRGLSYCDCDKEKNEILNKLSDLGSSKNNPSAEKNSLEPHKKKARINNEVYKNLSSIDEKEKIISSACKVFNVADLVNLIAGYLINSVSSFAKYRELNRTCYGILNGQNLMIFLSELNDKQLCLDIATIAPCMPFINKHLEQQEIEFNKVKSTKPPNTGAIKNFIEISNRQVNALATSAIKYNNIGVIRNLMARKKINIDTLSKEIYIALIKKNYDLFDSLLHLCPMQQRESIINNCLNYIIMVKNVEFEAIQLLIEKYHVNLNDSPILKNFIKYNPNHKASFSIVKYLVESGALITKEFEELRDEVSSKKVLRCAMHEIIKSQKPELIRFLLQNIDINTTDSYGNNILSIVFKEIIFGSGKIFIENFFELIKELLQLGVNPNTSNNEGKNSLMHYLENIFYSDNRVNLDIVKILIEFGYDLNSQDNDGNTSLFYNLSVHLKPSLECAKLLLKNGANLKHKNKRGESWLNYLAMNYSDTGSVGNNLLKLVKLGCDLNSTDENGNTPLHNYISNESDLYPNERLDIIQLLIKKGSNIKAKNTVGNTPLHLLLEILVGYSDINCKEFIDIFAPSINIKNNAGQTGYDVALSLLGTEHFDSIEARNMWLRIIQLIKPSM